MKVNMVFSNVAKDIGIKPNKVKGALAEAGLNQGDLAKAWNKTETATSQKINGGRITDKEISILSRMTDKDVNYFFSE